MADGTQGTDGTDAGLGGWRIGGRMEFTGGMEGEYDAHIDSRLIVREAKMNAVGPKGYGGVIYVTEGVAKGAGIAMAAKGKFRRFNPPQPIRPWSTPEPEQRDVEFVGLRRNLTDAEFEELTRIDVPEGTTVMDDTVRYPESGVGAEAIK